MTTQRDQHGQIASPDLARELGRRGGQTTVQRHGREHMRAIARRGYDALVAKYGKSGAATILARGRTKGASAGGQARWQAEIVEMGDYLDDVAGPGSRGWRPEEVK